MSSKKNQKTSFLGDVLKLSLGTVFSILVPLLVYPILTRIYSPSDFGSLSILLSIIPIVSVLFSGMYEGGILISGDKKEAANLVGLILHRSIKLFIIFFPIAIFLNIFLDSFPLFTKDFIGLLYISLISAFLTVIYNVYNEWCVTFNYFSNLAKNKIYFSSFTNFFKLLIGFISPDKMGLILGDLIGRFFSSSVNIFQALKSDSIYFKRIQVKKFNKIKDKFKDFPKYLLPDQLVNHLSGSIHVFLIGPFFGKEELGYLAVSASLLTLPVSVITASVKDVFRQRATQIFNETGNCREFYLKSLKWVFLISLLIFIPLYFLVPSLFTFFLGEQWLKAAIYSQILMPYYITNFVSMSLVGILIVANKMKFSFYWQLLNLIVSFICLSIGIIVFDDFTTTLFIFMIGRSLVYISYIFLSYYFSKKIYN